MPTLEAVTAHELLTVQDSLREKLKDAQSFERCAQIFSELLFRAFPHEIALSRIFMTIPFASLPEHLRRSAWSVAEGQTVQAQLKPSTPVLTLLGSFGEDPDWCDRSNSRGHMTIPLCSNSFVDTIPMVARMLQEMGVDLGLKLDTDRYVKNILGVGWVGLFYVEDARTARDDKGRRVIPSAEFVEKHSIRTVFGLGKAYGDGSIVSSIAFTKKIIPKARVELLVPFLNLFKASTNTLVRDGRLFVEA